MVSFASLSYGQGGINMATTGTDQVWRGVSAGSHAGASLDLGAMNTGDDRRDLIVGAPGDATTLGHVYVVFGGPVHSGLNDFSSANATYNGAATGDLFGAATAAGNIVTPETSTFRDLAVGAPGASGGRGIVYLFTGGVSPSQSVFAASAAVLRIVGAAGDQLGTTLATGDLDGDGYRELIIGAPGNSRLYVIRGGTGVSGTIDLSVTPASTTISAAGIGRFIYAGDITGDGRYDILIGAPFEDGSAGRVYVVAGRAGGLGSSVALPAAADYVFTGVNPGDQAGMGIRVANFDGDRYRDIVIGAPGADPAGRADAGAVYVLWGGPTLSSKNLAGADVIIYGEAAGFRTGQSLEAGDINRDTANDLILLAPGARSGAGEVHVYYGADRAVLPHIIDLASGMARRLYADPSAGAITTAAAFEVTGEGARDIVVGVKDATTPGGTGAGLLYFSLSPKLMLSTYTLSFNAVQGSVTQSTIDVLNPGIGVVTWVASSNASWLDVLTPSGEAGAGSPGVLTVAAKNTLAAGTYGATITLTSTSPHLTMVQSVTVSVSVRACAVGGRGASDFNGDSCADLAVYRPSTGQWFIQDQAGSVKWGEPTDIPVPGDYDGDGKTDIAVYRPSSGQWYVYGQSTWQWGLPGDIPVPADYNGDGRTDIAVYRPSTQTWYVMNQFSLKWGIANDTPVPGDYDGDGRADVAVYRRSSGMWYIRDVTTVKWGGPGYTPVPADYNGDGRTEIAVVATATGTWHVKDVFTTNWGIPGDIPIALDRDGDNAADLVVYRPSTNTWYIKNMMRGTTATETWGIAGDAPAVVPRMVLSSVASDGDGDRKADLAIWRPGTGDWYLTYSGGGFSTSIRKTWGMSTDTPCAADYDGDGRVDPCVFRASTGYWYVLLSSSDYNSWYQPILFGASGDVPVPGDYVGGATAQVAYWRASTGQWSVSGGPTATLGTTGDVPVAADYDGDGRTDMAVFRPSTGQWMIRTSSSEFASVVTYTFGQSGDTPVPGDYDGDGKSDLAFYRPSEGLWHIKSSSDGFAMEATFAWGLSTDTPVAGDFDGDGITDIAVWRDSTGMWYVRNQFTFKWGISGDRPVLKR